MNTSRVYLSISCISLRYFCCGWNIITAKAVTHPKVMFAGVWGGYQVLGSNPVRAQTINWMMCYLSVSDPDMSDLPSIHYGMTVMRFVVLYIIIEQPNVWQAYISSAGYSLVLLGKELCVIFLCSNKYMLHFVQLLCWRKVAMHGGIWQLRNFFQIDIGTKHLNIARELIQWMFGLTLVRCFHYSSTEMYSSVICFSNG